jgi:DNA polymerase V
MPTFGLIDGNSFYCSCERAFAPELWGRPVIVLSNNDGCAIARTAEAKQLGIKMGAPWHLIRGLPAHKDVAAFSSNYALYADQSRRIYQVLTEHVPSVEPYSIDEMFMDLTGLPDLLLLCHRLRERVRQIAKIPTCIGIGPSKTIAKLANGIAKDQPEMQGICDLRDPGIRAALYRQIPVSEVWGIGGKTAEKLASIGVATIEDFLRLDHRAVRDMLTVVGARVQAELRGISCLPLSLMTPPKKGIAVTHTFGRIVTEWADLREAVAAYATRAGEKLRTQGLQAVTMLVFLHTNPHSDDPWHSGQRSAQIEPTSDTRALIGEAVRLLRAIWRPGFRYYKAGIMLTELVPAAAQPAQLFPTRDPIRSARAMAALDAVNARFGRDTLRPLATGLNRTWKARAGNLSPRYTTRIEEILEARAF